MSSSTQLVFIPASLANGSADSFDTVSSVLDFAEEMLGPGLYEPDELSPEVMQLRHLNQYYSEIMNGGHSQLLSNAGAELATVVRGAVAALSAMGATGYLLNLLAFESWMRAKGLQDGTLFDADDPEGEPNALFERLDDRLYMLDQSERLQDIAARWLLGWDNLRIVEDEKLTIMRAAQIMTNPKRIPRQIKRRIARFDQGIGDALPVGLALAVASISPHDMLLDLQGGRPRNDNSMLWMLRTSQGDRLGVTHDKGADIFSSDAVDFYSSNYDAPLRNRLGHADQATIDAILAYDSLGEIAVAADMLLRKHHTDLEDDVFLAPAIHLQGQPPIFSLCAGKKHYLLTEAGDGFDMTQVGRDEFIDHVRHEDIGAYLDEIEALERDIDLLPTIH